VIDAVGELCIKSFNKCSTESICYYDKISWHGYVKYVAYLLIQVPGSACHNVENLWCVTVEGVNSKTTRRSMKLSKVKRTTSYY